MENPLFTGDISKYRRDNLLQFIIVIGGIASISGFTFERYIGLMMIMVTLAVVIYVLWTITPESQVIRFEDDNIILFGKRNKKISYEMVTKFECHNAPRIKGYFKLHTRMEDFVFCEMEGESWDKLADGIIEILHNKNSNIKIRYYNFYKKWEEWDK